MTGTCGKKWGSGGASQTCIREPAAHDGKHRDTAGREWCRRADTKNARPADRQEARQWTR